MRRVRALGALLISLGLLGSSWLEAAAVAGRVTAPFLKIPMGVRATGMGEAFTGVADDDQAMYYNPSGLTLVERPMVSLMHLQGFGGVNYEYMGLVSPSGLFGIDIPGSIGLSYRLLDIQETELTRALPDGSFDTQQASRNQSWSAGGSVISLGWGWKPKELISLGVAVKMVNQQVVEESETIGAVDLGVTSKFKGLPGFQLGFGLQNIGPEGSEAPLPSRIRSGISYRAMFGSVGQHHWILSADAASPMGPSDEITKFSAGTELSLGVGIHRFAARAGYRYPSDLGSLAGLTIGGGYGVLIMGTEVGLDYAFVPFGILGESHRMGLTTRFGKRSPQPEPKAEPKPKPKPQAKPAAELPPPFNLRGLAGSRKARMNWEYNSDLAVGFNLYLSYKPKGPWFKLNKRPIEELEQVVGSLFNNVTTYFVATAVGSDGKESKRSNIASVKPLKDSVLPGDDETDPQKVRESTLPPLP